MLTRHARDATERTSTMECGEMTKKKLCDYEKDCARSTFATCMGCDKNYKNQEPERPPIICNGCHPKPCSGCRWENERCNHRPSTKGDHLCRYFSEPAEPERVIPLTPEVIKALDAIESMADGIKAAIYLIRSKRGER